MFVVQRVLTVKQGELNDVDILKEDASKRVRNRSEDLVRSSRNKFGQHAF